MEKITVEKAAKLIRKYIEQGKYINITEFDKVFTFNVNINEKDSAEISFDMEDNTICVVFWNSSRNGFYYKRIGKLTEKHEFDNKDKIIVNNLILEVRENNETLGRSLFNHYLGDLETSSADELLFKD